MLYILLASYESLHVDGDVDEVVEEFSVLSSDSELEERLETQYYFADSELSQEDLADLYVSGQASGQANGQMTNGQMNREIERMILIKKDREVGGNIPFEPLLSMLEDYQEYYRLKVPTNTPVD